jgi:signal transduction histidine kinase
VGARDELDEAASPDPRWEQAARASTRLAACRDEEAVGAELINSGRRILRARRCGVTWVATCGAVPGIGPGRHAVAVGAQGTPFGTYWLVAPAAGFTDTDRELIAFLTTSAAAALAAVRNRDRLRSVEHAAGSQRERLLVASALEVARAREMAAGDGLRLAIAGQEAERARIARELHDESGQVLTAVALHLRALEGREIDAPYREQLANLRRAVVEAAEGLHQLITQLRPPGLRDGGLAESISDLAERLPSGPRIDVSLEGLPRDLPQEIEIAIYRVVQEALTNAARHSGAAHIGVMAGCDGTHLRIVIDDDGRGFRTDAPTGRLGLAGLRERVQLIGGELHVESAPGAGTSVTVELDLDGVLWFSPDWPAGRSE